MSQRALDLTGNRIKPGRQTTPAPCAALQRTAIRPAPAGAPPVVHEVLRSPGRPLDARTRAVMEPRFNHDFSRVRIHSDARAARSADAVDALAYTVGNDVAFAAGRYAPATDEGRRLLAHELAHVAQQSAGRGPAPATSPAAAEGEAEEASRRVARGAAAPPLSPVPGSGIQRQERKNPKDDKAKAIIDKAKDGQVALSDRAVGLVNDIIATYYATDAAKVDAVVYDNAKAKTGLATEPVGTGAGAKGRIYVGDAFVNGTDQFAHRVLQVEHEILHIDQYRGGKLSGRANKDKREFLAFHHEALEAERAGTGKLPFGTRRDIVDAALGYYYCLSPDEQATFVKEKAALLARRAEVDGKGGNAPVPVPTECKRQG